MSLFEQNRLPGATRKTYNDFGKLCVLECGAAELSQLSRCISVNSMTNNTPVIDRNSKNVNYV